MKCKRSTDARRLDHLALQLLRQRAVEAVREGCDIHSVAAVMGLNVRTVFRWMAAYAKGGPDALLAKPVPGRPPRRNGIGPG